jgi:hypothetical protein
VNFRRPPAPLLVAFLSCALLTAPSASRAAQKSHTIVEPLGADHGPQVVRLTETFPQPGVKLETLGATVNGQPAFFQRRALESYPDGSVKTGEWSFWLHLASPKTKAPDPKQSGAVFGDRFEIALSWGERPSTIPAFAGTGVEVKPDGEFLLVRTGAARFRLPNSKVTAGPNGPQGPIAAFSNGDDPKWYGTRNYFEAAAVAKVATEILESGPVAATIRVTHTFEDGKTWRSDLTFVKDSPVVRVEDATDASGNWWIDLGADMQPDTQFAAPWFDWESSNQRGGWSEKTLREWRKEEIRGGEWPNLKEFFRLDPKWHDYQYMKGPAAMYYNKAARAQSPTAFGIFAWNLTRWHPTYNNRPRVLLGDGAGKLLIRVPLAGGFHTRTLPAADPLDPVPRVVRTATAERSWGMAALPAPDIRAADSFAAEAHQSVLDAWAKDPKKQGQEPTDADFQQRAAQLAAASATAARNLMLRTMVTVAHMPVQKVKDWVIEWPDTDKNVDPGIFKNRDDYARLQAELKAGTTPTAQKFKAYVEEMRRTLTQSTDSKGNPTETAAKEFGRDWQIAQDVLAADLTKGPLFTYKPTRGSMVASSQLVYTSSYADASLNPTTAPRGARTTLWTNSIGSSHKADGMAGPNREAARMAYIFSDPDFWPGRYYDWGIGNPNFHTDMYNIPGIVAAQLRTHPHAQRWAAYGMREIMGDIGRSSWQPGGAWTESPGYTGHTFGVILPTAHAFARAGFKNLFQDPNFQASIRYIMNLMTPVDPRLARRGGISLGDSPTTFPADDVLAQAAKGIQPLNPRFASELMAGYAATQPKDGGSGIAPGTLQEFLLSMDLSIQPDPAWSLKSEWYAGFGAMLRSRFGKPDESLVAVKSGPARNHYQGDELSVLYWGNGRYVAVDYSSFYAPRMNPDYMHNKVTLGISSHGPAGRTMAFARSDAGDYYVGEHEVDGFQLISNPYFATRSVWDYQSIPTTPKQIRRHSLLVKHPETSKLRDYLVIRDEIRGNQKDRLQVHRLNAALSVVIPEMIAAYRRDMHLVPGMAAGLAEDLRAELKRYGATDAAAGDLVTAATKVALAPEATTFDLATDAPDLAAKIKSLIEAGAFEFNHQPQAQFHLLAHENPVRTKDRFTFKGQMGGDIVLYVATGQDPSKADIRWAGWGHNRRPEGFPTRPDGKGGKSPAPWFGGQWHSYRHGLVLGRDIRTRDDTDPARASLPLWTFGEAAQWVSLPFEGKENLTTILYPVPPGGAVPEFETLEGGDAVKVTVNGESEIIHVATGKPVKVVRGGKDIVIAATIPAIGDSVPDAFVPRRTVEVDPDKPDDKPSAPEDAPAEPRG